PLYDAGKDATTDRYRKAFDVFRQLNTEIRDQNILSGGLQTFQIEAAKQWLKLHPPGPDGLKHVPPYERGFGSTAWDPNNISHRKLLYYFNRYCYRCHSSVKYDVFDLAAVKIHSSV